MKRKILRNMARYNMQKQGLHRLNKKLRDENGEKYSMFSGFWRDYVPKEGVKQ